MDPLTHTLVGANLAATRLGEKSRLAAAALVIGANLPDVDAILYFTGHDDLALGFRRGWTHGILALVVLPFVLTALLLVYARVRPAERQAKAVPLLALSFLAILTHPFLDWLNNYGMRWLMPFRGTWTYGDSVYIMDPWLWLILGFGVLAGSRRTFPVIAGFVVTALLLSYVVGQRSPRYLIIIAIVVAALFATLFMVKRRHPALALAIAAAYIMGRLTIHEVTEHRVRNEIGPVDRLMVAPHPIDPTRWDFVAQTGDVYRYGRFTWLDRKLAVAEDRLPVAKDSPEWEAARRDPSIRGFLTWVRFPWYEVEHDASETRVLVHDARYAVRRRAVGWGGVEVVIKR